MSGTTPRRSGPGGGALTKKGDFKSQKTKDQIVFLLHLNQGQNVKWGRKGCSRREKAKMVILERESLTSL